MDDEIPVDIPDVWAGPNTYAEDYYSGGDVRRDPGVEINAHHLGNNDQEVNIEVVDANPNAEAMPKDQSRVGLEDAPEALEEVSQTTESAQITDKVKEIVSSSVPEILEQQESRHTPELNFDDLYDIDMASFDNSTFTVDQTGMVNSKSYVEEFTQFY